MIPSLGNISLWITLLLSISQAVNSNRNNSDLKLKINHIFASAILFFSLISFFSLMFAYIVSDFSVSNVYQNSHTTKPLIYKISAVWGNHEGSMLLWNLVLCLFNYFISRLYNKNNHKFISYALETQSIIIFGFLLFTVLTSNPFYKMNTVELNGLGFNPILQDPSLAIHPPLLYVGYVGLSAVFSLGIAALRLNKNEIIPWHIYMKPFVVVSWTFLTIGIAFGSFWAYYELGWGGWWFWDPVENASFMPWLIATALLHSLITVDKKNSLKTWVILLSILSFLLCVIGTFLVRSGILTSVHTFALDPSRGIYILGFMTVLGSYALILFALKSKNYVEKDYISFLSKEGSILFNNIIMIITCSSVLLGTLYPLIVETFTNNKISVGEPYYNSIIVPMFIPAILVMGLGPIISWGNKNNKKNIIKTLPALIASIIITFITFLFYKSYSLMGVIGIFLANWIILNNLSILLQKKINQPISMIIAHLGIGLLILGITGSSVWQEEKIVKIKIGNEVKINNFNILFKEINEIKETNYIAIQGNFHVFDQNKNIVFKLYPEKRFYPITNIFTTEASIKTNLFGDLYIVIGDGNFKDGWVVRIYYNPLVIWIWIGTLIIFIGGILSMIINSKKIKLLS